MTFFLATTPKKQRISAIAALGRKTRAIGKNNDLLWRIPEDMKRLRALTAGCPIIMGSHTFHSIGRPLPNRLNIVLSSNPLFAENGVEVAHTIEEALAFAKKSENEEVFIFGGGQVYKETFPYIDRLYLTVVESDEEGDTFFPEYQHIFTKEIERIDREHEGLRYSFVTLERE